MKVPVRFVAVLIDGFHSSQFTFHSSQFSLSYVVRELSRECKLWEYVANDIYLPIYKCICMRYFMTEQNHKAIVRYTMLQKNSNRTTSNYKSKRLPLHQPSPRKNTKRNIQETHFVMWFVMNWLSVALLIAAFYSADYNIGVVSDLLELLCVQSS